MGPVIRRSRQGELVDRVRHVTDPVDVLVDGSAYADGSGYFFGPTVIDHVPAGHPLLDEQVPGPVIAVVRYQPGSAADIHHRDAHEAVRTTHSGAHHNAAASDSRQWFGSLPWDFDDAIRFLTKPGDGVD